MADPLVTSVRVETKGAHDHVTVWVRGGLAGTLIVSEGDGAALRNLLLIEHARVGGAILSARRLGSPVLEPDDFPERHCRLPCVPRIGTAACTYCGRPCEPQDSDADREATSLDPDEWIASVQRGGGAPFVLREADFGKDRAGSNDAEWRRRRCYAEHNHYIRVEDWDACWAPFPDRWATRCVERRP